MGEARFLGRIF